jgi:hypothetical protein
LPTQPIDEGLLLLFPLSLPDFYWIFFTKN